MTYITMEIRITRGPSAEPGRAEDKPRPKTYLVAASEGTSSTSINTAQAAFMLPLDVEQRLHHILVNHNLRYLEGQAGSVKDFGIELFSYLFRSEVGMLYSEVGMLYHEIKTRAVQQRSGIRLRLRIVPAELSTLPWELLHDNEQYLCLSSHPKILFARVPDPIVRKKKALSYDPPLRLLGITASPNGLDELDVDKEKGFINTALESIMQEKRVSIEWKRAEANVLSDLKFGDPWHILHFIGHGHFDEKENKEGRIVLEDAKGKKDVFDANRFRLALPEDIQLVFLNACDTARGDPLDYLSSFAYRLAISGTPAIVAMQFKITDDAAIQFARVFYERVADGGAVDEAVTDARHRIYVRNANSLEWIAPVLYISTSGSVLFKNMKGVKKVAGGGKKNAEVSRPPSSDGDTGLKVNPNGLSDPYPVLPIYPSIPNHLSGQQAVPHSELQTDPPKSVATFNGRGSSEDVAEDYEQIVMRGRRDAVAHTVHGDTCLEIGHYEEALEAYGQAIKQDPKSIVAYSGKGNVLLKLGRYEEALVAYKQVVRLDPDDVAVCNGIVEIGDIQFKHGHYEEARDAYELVVLQDPKSIVAYSGKGNVLLKLGRYEEALDAYKRVVRLDPSNLAVRNGIVAIGDAQFKRGYYGEALEAYEEVVKQDPESIVAYIRKGNALFKYGRYGEALEAYRQAAKLDPNTIAARDGMIAVGDALAELGNYKEAQKAYQQAARLKPSGRPGANL